MARSLLIDVNLEFAGAANRSGAPAARLVDLGSSRRKNLNRPPDAVHASHGSAMASPARRSC